MTSRRQDPILSHMTSRTYLESDQLLLAVPSACAKQGTSWAGMEHNQPTFAIAPRPGRPEAAL